MLRRRVHPQGCRQVLLLLLLLLLKELGVVGGKLILDQILGELKMEITHERERPQKNHPRLNAEELSFAAPVLVIYFSQNLGAFGHSVNPSNEPDKQAKKFRPVRRQNNAAHEKGKENQRRRPRRGRKTGDESCEQTFRPRPTRRYF